jgi:hypothetical protein
MKTGSSCCESARVLLAEADVRSKNDTATAGLTLKGAVRRGE